MNCVLTVFIDDLRVETTIKDSNGNYLTGTTLNNDEIYKTIYEKKQTYHGDNIINGLDYISVYIPMPNDDGKNACLFMEISTDHVKTVEAELAAGVSDLTIRIDSKKNDEIGKITKEINVFIESQQSLLFDVKQASDSLSEIGQSLASSSQQSASAISQIMANIESVNNSVEKQTMALQDVQECLNQNRENVNNLEELILKQSEGISESSAEIEEMIGNINAVTQSVGKMSQEYSELKNKTKQCCPADCGYGTAVTAFVRCKQCNFSNCIANKPSCYECCN